MGRSGGSGLEVRSSSTSSPLTWPRLIGRQIDADLQKFCYRPIAGPIGTCTKFLAGTSPTASNRLVIATPS
jgi:hypothetical protein